MALSYSEQKQIAARYARAAFDLAQEAKSSNEVAGDLMTLKAAIESSDGLRQASKNPLLSGEALSSAFEALLKKVNANTLSIQLTCTVIRNGRAAQLPMIAESFEALMDKAEGIVRGEVVTAKVLDEQEVEAIAKSLSSKETSMKLSSRVDESILGGMRLKLGSRMIDASVAGQLEKMKRELKQPVAGAAPNS